MKDNFHTDFFSFYFCFATLNVLDHPVNFNLRQKILIIRWLLDWYGGGLGYNHVPAVLSCFRTVNSVLQQKILKEIVQPSVCDQKLKPAWFIQQDNVLKHTSKLTFWMIRQTKGKSWEWPIQSQDLHLFEMLWHNGSPNLKTPPMWFNY